VFLKKLSDAFEIVRQPGTLNADTATVTTVTCPTEKRRAFLRLLGPR
jgi:hypothetical protein